MADTIISVALGQILLLIFILIETLFTDLEEFIINIILILFFANLYYVLFVLVEFKFI